MSDWVRTNQSSPSVVSWLLCVIKMWLHVSQLQFYIYIFLYYFISLSYRYYFVLNMCFRSCVKYFFFFALILNKSNCKTFTDFRNTMKCWYQVIGCWKLTFPHWKPPEIITFSNNVFCGSLVKKIGIPPCKCLRMSDS